MRAVILHGGVRYMSSMSLGELISYYESLEKNKGVYLDYIEQYKSRMNDCISDHDLEGLDGIMNEYYNLNIKLNNEILTSDFMKINRIIEALYKERMTGFTLFWDDINNFDELVNKYNKTVLMIRRLMFDLQENFKTEALDFLGNISPFIVKATYEDTTNILGMEERTYLSLAKNSLKKSKQEYATIYLEFVKRLVK